MWLFFGVCSIWAVVLDTLRAPPTSTPTSENNTIFIISQIPSSHMAIIVFHLSLSFREFSSFEGRWHQNSSPGAFPAALQRGWGHCGAGNHGDRHLANSPGHPTGNSALQANRTKQTGKGESTKFMDATTSNLWPSRHSAGGRCGHTPRKLTSTLYKQLLTRL